MGNRKDFLLEETRCGHVVSKTMKKIWACQLNILELFSDVCSRNGLRFWLDSGTLLGAVRHKGYIPWDDDIDVVMFREDYDKLVNIAQREFTHPYIFQTAYTESNFVRGHAQLRDARTTAIIPCELHKDFNQGIFIDIFVMDNVPDDKREEDRQMYEAYKLRDRLEALARPVKCMESRAQLYAALKHRFRYPTRRAFRKLYKRYEDVFRQNPADTSSMIACTSWVYKSERRDRHLYDETIYLDFEYLKMPAPKGYDRLLTIQYGDYMTPVMAPTCHGDIIFDPDTPADLKIKELRKKDK